MATEREKMGRLVLKASTGVHGEIAKKLALELSAALAAPPVEQQAAQVISAEDSLRTLLRWERERVEALEDELRDLRSKLPGATERDAAFMGLLTARPTEQPSQDVERLQNQPLSPTIVRALSDAAGYLEPIGRADFINGLRWGERAHGINAARAAQAQGEKGKA